jgi:hypothetical protein
MLRGTVTSGVPSTVHNEQCKEICLLIACASVPLSLVFILTLYTINKSRREVDRSEDLGT